MNKQWYMQKGVSYKEIIVKNFVAGTAWGIGSIVGAAIILVMLGYVASRMENWPLIGKIVQQVMEEISRYR